MYTFEFFVDELNQGVIEVQADTPEQAKGLAEQAYLDGDVVWGNSELTFTPKESE
jgi:hypothetical protein